MAFSEGEKRLALVIGNSNYDKGPLDNPVNDALLMAQTLEVLDFDVILDTNIESKESFIRTIRELSATHQTGCMIVGFKTADGEFVINPSADTELVPNSKLFVLGKAEQINELNKILNI